MTPAADMPVAEIDIDAALVRALLSEQHPDLADLTLTQIAFGWDNVVFRLGDELVVRLPRRQMAAELVEHEQRWLPVLAPLLPLPIPAPVRIGRPSDGRYPWAWSVCPWLAGEMAAHAPVRDQYEAATTLGWFVAALHVEAPVDAPHNPYRGVPLHDRDQVTRERIDQLADVIDAAVVVRRWEESLDVAGWSRPPVWLHGDLHPANLLVADGRLSAVIDFGDICGGDPASDLAVGWFLFDDPHARATFFRTAAYVDDLTWARARGWAVGLAVAFLANSADNPTIHAIGHAALDSVLRDPDW